MLAAPAERPKIASAPISVVLFGPPATEIADATLRGWLEWIGQRGDASEILLVCDAGCAQFDLDRRVRVIHQVAPLGEGAFLQTALCLVKHPLLVTSTVDEQFTPADMALLVERIDDVDLVAGARVSTPPPWWLRVLGFFQWLFAVVLLGYWPEPRWSWLGWGGWPRRMFVRHFFGVRVRDPECLFRLYRTEVLRRFPIQSTGRFERVEVLAKTNHLGCMMAEAPVAWKPPTNEGADPAWKTECRQVRRDPDFGSGVLSPPPNCEAALAKDVAS